jgi:hypothetical protein
MCLVWDGTQAELDRLERAGWIIVACYGRLVQVTLRDTGHVQQG